MPKISIVMAVYNGSEYLKDSIESVLSQSFKDFEFIIIDDCSTDTTADLIKSYKDKRIIYSRNKKNKGQTASLNIGLHMTTAAYIARIDADDIFLPNKLERQYEFMQSHSEIAVCGTQAIKIDENGSEKGFAIIPTDEDEIRFNIFYGSPLIHVSVIMRKEAILKFGGYDETLIYSADFGLWSNLIRNNYQIANMSEVLIKYREFSNSLGSRTKLGKNTDEGAKIIQKNIEILTKHKITTQECRNIILAYWPNTGLQYSDCINTYITLLLVAKKYFSKNKIHKIKKIIHKIFLWSLIKQFTGADKFINILSYLKKGLLNVRYPSIVFLTHVAMFIAILGEKNILYLRNKIRPRK